MISKRKQFMREVKLEAINMAIDLPSIQGILSLPRLPKVSFGYAV